MKLYILSIIALSNVACGKPKNRDRIDPLREVSVHNLGQILDGSCSGSDADELCELISVSESWQSHSARGERPGILVIDRGGGLTAHTRYKSQVDAVYKIGDRGTLQVDEEGAEAPRGAVEFLSSLDYDGVAFSDTQPHFYDFVRKYGPILRDHYLGQHGVGIFNYIASHNPSHPLSLISNFDDILTKDLACDLGKSDQANNRAREYVETLASGIEKIVISSGIRFINLSAGGNEVVFRKNYQSSCHGLHRRGAQQYSKLWLEFLTTIGSIDGVYLVQAGVTAKNDIDQEAFEPDCALIPNRVRVGYVAQTGFTIPQEGSASVSLLPEAMQGTWQCMDLYVNSGFYEDPSTLDFVERDPQLKFSRFGVGEYTPGSGNATSWSAPLALTMLASWDHYHGDESSSSVTNMVKKLTNESVNRIFDPVAHGKDRN